MDFIITWNFKHINNPFTKVKIRQLIENRGFVCPELCSPDEFLDFGDQFELKNHWFEVQFINDWDLIQGCKAVFVK